MEYSASHFDKSATLATPSWPSVYARGTISHRTFVFIVNPHCIELIHNPKP